MAKDKSIPSNLVFTREKFKYDTIEDMKNDVALKIGDVVELNGYYEVGDGADHKRKIEAQDDGSGVMIKNVNNMAVELTLSKSEPELYRVGLYANIVHNGEVNVSWFGAKGDGVTDDTEAIQKAIDYCSGKEYIDFDTKEIPCIKFNSKVYPITSLNLKSRIKLIGNGQNSTYLIRYGSSNTNDYMINAIGYRTQENDHEHFKYSIGISKMTITGDDNLSSAWIDSENLFSNGIKFECGTDFVVTEVTLVRFKTALKISELYDSSFNTISVLGSGNDNDYGIIFGRLPNEEQIGNDGNNAVRFDNFRFERITLFSFAKLPRFQRENRFTNGKIESCTLKFSGNSSTSFNSVNSTSSKYIFNEIYSDIESSEGFGFTFIDCVFYYKKTEDVFIDIKNNGIISTPKFISCFFKSMAKNSFVCEGDGLIISNSQFYDCDSPIIKSGGYSNISNCVVLGGEKYDYDFDVGEISIFLNVTTLNKKLKLKQGNRNVNLLHSDFETLTKEEITNGISSEVQKLSNNLNNQKRDIATIESIWNGDTYITNLNGDVKLIQVTTPVTQLNTPYYATKMQQKGVYDDFIMYMDDKVAYDKEQRKLEEQRQLSYEEALKENPELTYEEFMSVQPMTLNLVEEPQPSQALKDFMEKYL